MTENRVVFQCSEGGVFLRKTVADVQQRKNNRKENITVHFMVLFFK
jgi:hypothetical protein